MSSLPPSTPAPQPPSDQPRDAAAEARAFPYFPPQRSAPLNATPSEAAGGQPKEAPAAKGESASGRKKPRSNPPGSRELVLGWCLWLLGSWLVTLSFDSAVPATRWMIYSAAVGVMAIWPVLRLSQDSWDPVLDRPAITPGTIFLDWLSLSLVMQAVVWPLRLSALWTIEQAAWLDASLLAWSLLTAAVLGAGVRARRGSSRTLVMVLCLLLIVGEPLVMALANWGAPRGQGLTWNFYVSPLQVLWVMTGSRVDWTLDPWRWRILGAAGAAVALWIGLGVIGVLRSLGRRER